MEWLIHSGVIALSLLLGAIKSVHYMPSATSDFELERQVAAGNENAVAERQWRALLPGFVMLQQWGETLLVVIIATIMLATMPLIPGVLFALVYILLAQVIAWRGLLASITQRIRQKMDATLAPIVQKLMPVLGKLAPKPHKVFAANISSRDELLHLIKNETHVLSEAEKTALLSSFDFGQKTIADAMTPAERITTVAATETVGPVLLDKLHKAGQEVFVAVKNDLSDVQGLLYMRDLVPLHSDIKTVQDALRPNVHYLKENEWLGDVLAASLKTGRQLFLVANQKGEVTGMVTLSDALGHLTGGQLNQEVALSADPTQLA